MSRTVKLYDHHTEGYVPDDCIAIVKYTDNLDTWDGRNRSSGSTGHHIGIRKITRGQYEGQWYVCHGSDWQGSCDIAFLITEYEAKQLCLNHDHDMYEELFGDPLDVL